MNINLEYYKAFYYVAKLGSISAAANKLFISQPAVSQIIKQLEHNLGSELFFRSSRGVKLTPQGTVLFEYVSQGYEYFELAESMFKELLTLESGEIRIGASDMTLQFYLLPYLEHFHSMYPKVKIKVSNAPTPETIKNLKSGGIDFGVVTAPFSFDSSIEMREVCDIQDCFVAEKKFSQFDGRTINFHELASFPLIMLEKNTSTRRFLDDFMQTVGVLIDPEFELATSELIVQFAKRGLGIGCVVENFAEKAIASGELFKLSIYPKIPKRKMCVITSSKAPISPAGKKLLELL